MQRDEANQRLAELEEGEKKHTLHFLCLLLPIQDHTWGGDYPSMHDWADRLKLTYITSIIYSLQCVDENKEGRITVNKCTQKQLKIILLG